MLYFGDWTRGDEGLVIQQQRARHRRSAACGSTSPTRRPATYRAGLSSLAIVLLITLAVVRSPFGRVLVAIRENEERTKMLGYDTFANKLAAIVLSGTICAAAGAAYVLLFGYVGSTLGLDAVFDPAAALGAARRCGHHARAAARHAVHVLRRRRRPAATPRPSLLVVGVVLILLVLFFPEGHSRHASATAGLRWLP